MATRSDDPIRAKCFHPFGKFVEFPRADLEKSIPEKFEKIVSLHSERIAVSEGIRVITYEQLNKMANRIARAIVDKNGASRQPIALLFDPGIAAAAAMLGALKAGRCYVFLDPSFPLSRIQLTLEDSQAELILTESGTAANAGTKIGVGVRSLKVDDISPNISDENLRMSLSPDTPSFIVYTSGSTGRPKGVLHTHRTALHAAKIITNLVHLCAEDRVALPLSYSFSASIRYVFGTLLNGGALFPFNLRKEGTSALVEWVDQQAISVCGFTGSMFRQWLSDLAYTQKSYSSLRVCCVGSESVSKTDVELYQARLPQHTFLATTMGLNETGVVCSLLIHKATEISESIVPAGYAVDDKEIFLLNDAGEKVGIDTVGEVVVQSEYLSPGYWRQPELTASKFASDPASKKRVYFTGDSGRMSPDGCLHFIGRKDLTVKIRGYNIETPKVEMALLQHPGVEQAAVVARQNRNGDAKLTAYIAATGRDRPSCEQLTGLLRKTLPDYMIPSIYVELDSLPLTPTGKIDRKSLPEPTRTRPRLEVAYLPPRNASERELAKIWEDVLDVRPIGVFDKFFSLGGHSLNASQIVSRVFQKFQLRISLRALFESATVADMAGIIDAHQGELLGHKELESILNEFESLSDAEAERLVSERLRKNSQS